MTTLAERYEGNFVEALDLREAALVPVKIEAVVPPDTEKDARGRLIKKAILRFHGPHKGLIVNKTNYRILKAVFGRNPTDWVGKEIVLQRRYLPPEKALGVENELCIRIIPPAGTLLPKIVRDYMGTAAPAVAKQ